MTVGGTRGGTRGGFTGGSLQVHLLRVKSRGHNLGSHQLLSTCYQFAICLSIFMIIMILFTKNKDLTIIIGAWLIEPIPSFQLTIKETKWLKKSVTHGLLPLSICLCLCKFDTYKGPNIATGETSQDITSLTNITFIPR